jgi:hypothetical protein
MKIGEVRFSLSGMPIEARDLDLSLEEFKDLTTLLRQLQEAQLEIEKLRKEAQLRVIRSPT